MPLYDTFSDFTPRSPSTTRQYPAGLSEVPALRQTDHAQNQRQTLTGAGPEVVPQQLEEYLTPGFRALDENMRQYWSGIRVPTRDSYRFLRIKVAGGDKSLMIWSDDLKEGRVRLPVAALDRTGMEWNPEKFSPPYHAMTGRFLSRRSDRWAKVFRPVPYLVSYTMIIWAERKRDAEYATFQVLPRFNPLAEFRMYDGHVTGNVQIRFGGATDASDKEAGHDQLAKVRYEIQMVCEAWLPMPEVVVPTVLGKVQVLSEQPGEILLVAKGGGIVGAGGVAWQEPIQTVQTAKLA